MNGTTSSPTVAQQADPRCAHLLCSQIRRKKEDEIRKKLEEKANAQVGAGYREHVKRGRLGAEVARVLRGRPGEMGGTF